MISESVGSPSTVAAHQHTRTGFSAGTHSSWQSVEGLIDHGDVISSSVGPGVAGPQDPSQGLPAADFWSV